MAQGWERDPVSVKHLMSLKTKSAPASIPHDTHSSMWRNSSIQ